MMGTLVVKELIWVSNVSFESVVIPKEFICIFALDAVIFNICDSFISRC